MKLSAEQVKRWKRYRKYYRWKKEQVEAIRRALQLTIEEEKEKRVR